MELMSRRVFLSSAVAPFIAALAGCDTRRSEVRSTLPGNILEDLGTFREQLVQGDPSFSPAKKAQALALLDTLYSNSSPHTAASLHLALAEIAALAGNGHTNLLNTNWQSLFNRVPLRFAFFGDRLYVGHAGPGWEPLQGREIATINGVPTGDLERAWSRYQGGEPGWRREFIAHFLESPEMLAAAGIGADRDALMLELVNDEGKTEPQRIAKGDQPIELEGIDALIPEPRLQLLYRLLGRTPPYFLQEPDLPFRYEPVPERGYAYLQFRSNTDFSGRQSIAAFVNQTEQHLSGDSPTNLIVDQRLNFGGDLTTTRQLMQRIPDLVDGKIIVLTSGRTFSAGISSTGYLKQAGGEQVTIIGEPVGDALEFWAEGDLLTLPAIEANFLFARERHNYRTGCPEPDCHSQVRLHPISVETLAPDELVPWTYKNFNAAYDPVLARALAMVETGSIDSSSDASR